MLGSRRSFLLLLGLFVASPARGDDCFPGLPYSLPFLAATSDQGTATWQGGDVGATAGLGRGRTFWVFGDTHIGRPRTPDRRAGEPFVGNTIALSGCVGGRFALQYFFRGTAEQPRPFFEDWAEGHRFWPAKPFEAGGRLYVLLHRIHPPADCRTTLIARVDNPDDHPLDWRIAYLTLCGAGNPTFGEEVFVDAGYAYLYGLYTTPQKQIDTVAIRLPLDALRAAPDRAEVSKPAEYLAADRTWKSGLLGPDYQPIPIKTTAGFSVRRNAALGRWQAVFGESHAAVGWKPGVKVALGSTPFGPWEQTAEIYRFPEMTPGDPLYNPDNVGMHVDEKPEFCSDPDARILFTYVPAPEKQSSRLQFDRRLYTPKVVEVANPFYDRPLRGRDADRLGASLPPGRLAPVAAAPRP